jgi:hypothetical protein
MWGRGERLGGREVDDKLELGGCLHRQVARLRPAQDAVDVASLQEASSARTTHLPAIEA